MSKRKPQIAPGVLTGNFADLEMPLPSLKNNISTESIDVQDALENSFSKNSKMRKSKTKKEKIPKVKCASEALVQEEFISWLKTNFPDIVYSADASGVKFTIGQTMKLKRSGVINRSFPDVFIYEPSGNFHGLFIELKKEDIRLKKQDGSWTKEHLKEQFECHQKLRQKQYFGDFALGLEQAKKLVLDYLKK